MKLMDAFAEHIRRYRDTQYAEIELRLGKINHDMFDTNVGQKAFERVYKGLQKYTGWERVENIEDEVYYWSSGIRCIYDGVKTVYQKKHNVFRQNINVGKSLDVRLSVSQEIPADEQTDEATRSVARRRTSFIRKNVRIDMTVVTGQASDKDCEDDVQYQIELEIVSVKTDQEIFSALHKVMNVLELI